MQFFPFSLQAGSMDFGATASGTSAGSGKGFASQGAGVFASFLDQAASKAAVRPELFRGAADGERDFGIWDDTRSGLSGFASKAVEGRFGAALSSLGGGSSSRGTAGAVASRLRSSSSEGGQSSKGLKAASSLKMTREDFAALKDGLLEAGLSEEDLDALGEKIDSDSGLTWGAFMSVLAGKVDSLGGSATALALSDTEERDLLCLFQKLGFTAQESKGLMGDLRNGKTSSVWSSVSDKLSGMSADSTISVRADELAALASAVKLSEEGSARLAALLGGQDKVTLSVQEMKTVMATLKGEVAEDVQHARKSGEDLLDLVETALGKAADRQSVNEQADARPDNDARNLKILGEENRRERARERAESRSDGHSAGRGDGEGEVASRNGAAEKAGSRGTEFAASTGDGEAGKAKSPMAKDAENQALDPKTRKAEQDARLARQGLADQGSGSGSGNDAKSGLGGETGTGDTAKEALKAWDTLMGKIRVERSQASYDAAAASQPVQDASANGLEDLVSRLGQDVTTRMMRQVESGILRNMGQGRKQLTLNLEPAELGKLNVVLQAKDGEVSAVFRAETQDAGRLLSEQLSHLKAQLEQQGIKVSKLEVQTQLQGQDQGNAWQGAEQHNQAQEQRNQLSRRGVWRLLRQESEAVAQEMQIDPQSAGIAREGLYVVA